MNTYLDGGSLEDMVKFQDKVSGYTTNPSLIRSLGIKDYVGWCKEAISTADGKPISIEVIDEQDYQIIRQAMEIASWGDNVWVKVPIIRSNGDPLAPVIRLLHQRGVRVNVTAILSPYHVDSFLDTMGSVADDRIILSIFAGRIADTLQDPTTLFDKLNKAFTDVPYADRPDLLWASTREIYNIVQARDCGADIITITPAMLQKQISMADLPLETLAMQTAQQFIDAAIDSEFEI